MVAVRRLSHGELVPGREQALDRDPCTGRDRGRGRVHDEDEAHGAEPYPYHRHVPGEEADRRAELESLAAEIVDCRACPRLVAWREQVAREKRAAFRDQCYWGRPVPGFG